ASLRVQRPATGPGAVASAGGAVDGPRGGRRNRIRRLCGGRGAPGMMPYVPSPATDLLLVRWWFQMQEAGELELVFGEAAQTLTSFLDAMRPPRHLLLYEADDDGLWMAFVVDPILR